MSCVVQFSKPNQLCSQLNHTWSWPR